MPAIFVHVSDIHFGQERDERIHTHSDAKNQLIADAAEVVRGLDGGVAHGILVTGDITQAGTQEQYEDAGEWLDRLAKAVGCEIFSIQMVPGNHDLDRSKTSRSGAHLLDLIKDGKADYEEILADQTDRAALFSRFEAYEKFSLGYDCALDTEGKYATNKQFELGSGRSIRFIRMNSALLCTGKEKEDKPELMIGARQFVIPRNDGVENIVLIHHPLHWFKDSGDARTYIRSRARIIISGHEHNPKISIDNVEDGCDVMMLAAGATVPFKSSETYTFTYNVIEFDWDSEEDALSVVIHPRAWNSTRTCFEADKVRLTDGAPRYVLGSPNFRKCGATAEKIHAPYQTIESPFEVEYIEPTTPELIIETIVATNAGEETEMSPDVPGYRLILLRFFRDLTEAERLRLLVDLNAWPSDYDGKITQALERHLLDWLIKQGRISEVQQMIDQLISNKK